MKKIKNSAIAFGLILFFSLLLSGCNQRYYPEEKGFNFTFTGIDYPMNPGPDTYLRFDAKYIGQDLIKDPYYNITSLNFEQEKTDAQISIQLASEHASFIKLVPEHMYQVTVQILGFINADLDLMITENDHLIFLGISGGYPGAGETPYEASPIQITNREILKNHYKLNPFDCVDKFTNTEIRFEANGATAELHQGETGKLGDYGINLLIARDVQYPNPAPCYDIYYPSESFIVYKN